ncbi:MAG: flagella accessory protein C [Thermoplasmataceae archaeon]
MGLFDKLKIPLHKETTAAQPQLGNAISGSAISSQIQSLAPGSIEPSAEQKLIDGLSKRMGNMENEVGKMSTTLESLKRGFQESGDRLTMISENVKMVVSLYEVVSKDFNPFLDNTPDEIKEITEELRKELMGLKALIDSALDDLRELYGTPDLKQIFKAIEQEDLNDQ